MSKYEKLIARLLRKPKDFSWDELVKLLNYFGYRLARTGKTGGSRARFIHASCAPITLHKPHPKPVLKRYQLEDIITLLNQEGLL